MASHTERPAADLDSARAVPYPDYVRAKGWSPSTGRRRRPYLPLIEVPGFPTSMIIPREAERVLAGERLAHPAPRRRPGRPRNERRQPWGTTRE
jgi:hypothetical protein